MGAAAGRTPGRRPAGASGTNGPFGAGRAGGAVHATALWPCAAVAPPRRIVRPAAGRGKMVAEVGVMAGASERGRKSGRRGVGC